MHATEQFLHYGHNKTQHNNTDPSGTQLNDSQHSEEKWSAE